MPSFVTLVCAKAGDWVSASAPTARPNALNDFDIAVSSLLAHFQRRPGLVIFAVERPLQAAESFSLVAVMIGGAYAIAPARYIASISAA